MRNLCCSILMNWDQHSTKHTRQFLTWDTKIHFQILLFYKPRTEIKIQPGHLIDNHGQKFQEMCRRILVNAKKWWHCMPLFGLQAVIVVQSLFVVKTTFSAKQWLKSSFWTIPCFPEAGRQYFICKSSSKVGCGVSEFSLFQSCVTVCLQIKKVK